MDDVVVEQMIENCNFTQEELAPKSTLISLLNSGERPKYYILDLSELS